MALSVYSAIPREEPGVLLVVLKEFPMTYICLFRKDGEAVALADSLVKLNRVEEAKSAFLDWMNGGAEPASEELSNKTKAE